MRSTKQMSITLSNEQARSVRKKVESGHYASESEVIRDGLRALEREDEALEHWLRTEVVASYEEMKAHPSRGMTVDQVLAKLAEHRKTRLRAS
ncbi:type II toxin-antitoxin system ParD family antitoxin [Terracidiphilus sp.]|jgi:putative addiction module CopG family antidote|uniref:type II toxin-antitoxin system ParD family antitoxin n=1 Tax=Terracidiphilus sp. TaxID=1964191 RepID=UPI003C158334